MESCIFALSANASSLTALICVQRSLIFAYPQHHYLLISV